MRRRPLIPTTTLHRDQARLVARADRSADAVERHVASVWSRLLDIIAAGGNWFAIFNAARATLTHLHSLPRVLATDLLDVAGHARETTIEHLGERIPALFEDDAPPAFDPWQAPRLTWEEMPLFQPPTIEETVSLVYSSGWQERLTAMTRLASPDALASVIANGWQQGLTPAAIARAIRPAVQGVQTSARRIARTESLRIAHDVQMDMYEQVPGVIGYQVHSMHFPATRHWHAARDGTIYYRDPQPGQKGFEKMPRPPREPDDPGERPRGTPQIAHNCLCWLTPVLAVNPFQRRISPARPGVGEPVLSAVAAEG